MLASTENRIRSQNTEVGRILILPPVAEPFWAGLLATIILAFSVIFLYVFIFCDPLASRIAILTLWLILIVPLAMGLWKIACRQTILITRTHTVISSRFWHFKANAIKVPRHEIQGFEHDPLPKLTSFKIRNISGYHKPRFWGGDYFMGNFASFSTGGGILLLNNTGVKYLICDHLTETETDWICCELNNSLQQPIVSR